MLAIVPLLFMEVEPETNWELLTDATIVLLLHLLEELLDQSIELAFDPAAEILTHFLIYII